MESISFCAYQDLPSNRGLNNCSSESTERPLVVNCAGMFETECPFTTYNRKGRLDYYLMHVLSGTLELSIGGEEIVASRGTVLLFPPRYDYRYTYTGGEALSYQWVHFTGSEARELLAACGFSLLPCACALDGSARLSQQFERLYDAFSKQDSFRDRELSAILDCLLITLGRLAEDMGGLQKNLAASLRYIMGFYASEIQIPSLAAMEHMSVPRYNVRFKELTGLSPTKYILRLRITSACELLKNTDFSVREIGLMCGYRDPYFFSRAFKAYMGCSPRAYRYGEDSGA